MVEREIETAKERERERNGERDRQSDFVVSTNDFTYDVGAGPHRDCESLRPTDAYNLARAKRMGVPGIEINDDRSRHDFIG